MSPVGESERIVAIDLIRGVALLGILLMNVQSFAMPSTTYINPTAYGDLTVWNRAVWVLCHVIADQKFISIFSMLFGAGILLMSERAGPRATALHYRRMTVLIVLGLIHGQLLWSGDILYAYGVCGLVVYLLRKAAPWRLIVLGLVVYSVSSAIFLHYGIAMRSWPPSTVAELSREVWRSSPADVARELAAYRGSWMQQQPVRSADATGMETFLFLIDFAWKSGGLMLVGMGLFKLDVFAGRRSRQFYVRMLAISLAVGLPLVLYGIWENFRAGWDVRYSLFFGSQFNYWGSVPLALAWIAAIALLHKSGVWTNLQRRLQAVGRTALSNYILQTLLCSFVFYGDGLALFGRVNRVGQILVVLAVWIAQLVIAPLWLQRFRFGPIEWTWRSLTYGRIQPMSRAHPAPI